MLFTILLAAHIVLAVLLIGVILIQQGKGATAGAAFGSGASSTVFGARGSASFLTRMTSVLALLFFSNSLLLAYLYGQTVEAPSLLDKIAQSPASSSSAPIVATPEDLPAAIEKAIKQGDVPAVPGTSEMSLPASSPVTPPADVPGGTVAADSAAPAPVPADGADDVPVAPAAPAAPAAADEAPAKP